MPREMVTTLLDVVALLLIAAGAAAGTFRWIGWACLVVAGGVVLAGSVVASLLDRPQSADAS